MREIKCRGKRIDKNEWTYGYLFKIWERTYILWGITNDIPNMIEVIPETVGQYTGLTDKNGKDVYEGDTFKNAEGFIGIIEFNITFQKMQICEYKNGCSTDEESHFDDIVARYGEVIGNIHEGKETE